MNNFDYIDEILKKGFDNMSVPPSTEWSAISAKMNAAKTAAEATASGASTTSGITQLGSNIIGYVANNIYTFATFLTATVISVGLIPSSTEINNSYPENLDYITEISILNESKASIEIETISVVPLLKENDVITEAIDDNQTVVVNVMVPVQKTIYKTKTQIIRDTVKVMKPVFSRK